MSALNSVCEDIVRKVISSKLDFKINQTPYSIYFSIRKKFAKNLCESDVSMTLGAHDEQPQHERFQQELLLLRNEYQRLYTFYQNELEKTDNLETQLHDLKSVLESKNIKETELENQIKKEVTGKKTLQVNFETKCIEVKQQKAEIESLKKGTNALSVALKTSKQESKEQKKVFEKKIEGYEKRVSELTAYKAMKLGEEREEKIRKKKEIKKSKRNNPSEIKVDVELETPVHEVATIEPHTSEDETIENKTETNDELAEDAEVKDTTENKVETLYLEENNNAHEEEFDKETFFAGILEKFQKKQNEVNEKFLNDIRGKTGEIERLVKTLEK